MVLSSHKNTATVSLPPEESHGGGSGKRDIEQWEALEALVARKGHKLRHVLELFPAYVRRYQLKRFLAHYDLFKKVVDLPGVIVELGVYRGVSMLTWAKLAEIFITTDPNRIVYGFDSFQGLQDFTDKDGAPVPQTGKVVGGWSAEAVRDEVEELIALCNADMVLPRRNQRAKLIVGDLADTLPKFLEENPGVRISLLHFDVDLYKPTKLGLELLYDRVVKGGVVVFDEYGLVPWEGETNAVDEFFRARGETPLIKKFPHTNLPGGYLIK
jgi:hypothetical protein